MLGLIDYLVDGPYVAAMRAPSLMFRGSANQRVVRLRPTAQDVTAKF